MEGEETKLICLQVRVPKDFSITRVKARKEAGSESQDVDFEIQEPFRGEVKDNLPMPLCLGRKRKCPPSEALGKAPELEVATLPDLISPPTTSDVTPSLLIMQPDVQQKLMECWEWNIETGNPIFHDPMRRWKRYVPDVFIEKAPLNAPGKKNITLSESHRGVLQKFVTGMTSDLQEFKIKIGDGTDTLDVFTAEMKLYRRIYGYDFKKIQVKRAVGYKQVTVVVKKLDDKLLSYSTLPDGEPPLSELSKSNIRALEKVNFNAKYGHYGPGTFWCRQETCTRKNIVSASAIVDYGREHRFYLNKRYTCAAKNCAYMLHCEVCKEESTPTRPMYANHCGFTEAVKTNMHQRLTQHFDAAQTSSGPALPPHVMQKYVRLNLDPDGVRQDSHYHFAYEHDIGNEAARLTVFESLPVIDGRVAGNGQAERRAKVASGSYNYMGFGRGGLNRYGKS